MKCCDSFIPENFKDFLAVLGDLASFSSVFDFLRGIELSAAALALKTVASGS